MNKNHIITLSLTFITISLICIITFIIYYNKYYYPTYNEISLKNSQTSNKSKKTCFENSNEIDNTFVQPKITQTLQNSEHSEKFDEIRSEIKPITNSDTFMTKNLDDHLYLLFNFLFTSDNLRKSFKSENENIKKILQNINKKYEESDRIEIKEEEKQSLKSNINMINLDEKFMLPIYLVKFINKFIEDDHITLNYIQKKCLECNKIMYDTENYISFYFMPFPGYKEPLKHLMEDIKIINLAENEINKECECYNKNYCYIANNYVSLGDFAIFRIIFNKNTNIKESPVNTHIEIENNGFQIKGIIMVHNDTSFNIYRYKEGEWYKINNDDMKKMNDSEIEEMNKFYLHKNIKEMWLIYDRV